MNNLGGSALEIRGEFVLIDARCSEPRNYFLGIEFLPSLLLGNRSMES
jgi:hypothetical protein